MSAMHTGWTAGVSEQVTNWIVQTQKIARDLKVRILKAEGLYTFLNNTFSDINDRQSHTSYVDLIKYTHQIISGAVKRNGMSFLFATRVFRALNLEF